MDAVFRYLDTCRMTLCDRPELVKLSMETQGKYNEYSFSGDYSQLGFLIGKKGNVVKSIRLICIAISVKNDLPKIIVKIESQKKPSHID